VSPDEVMTTFERKIKLCDENISVLEFEKKYNSLINVVYDKTIQFPEDTLNIQNKFIVYTQYN
jgi:UDP-N-acetylglucosamine 2-epimerase (non-hydrolysing)